MKFHIIENHQYNINYEEFKKDFTNPSITVDKLTKKYKINRTEYNKLRKKIIKETNLTSKPYKTMKNQPTKIITSTTYIKKKNDYYYIQKKINGKRKNFGTYNNIETARKVRNQLIKHNWDNETYKKLYQEYGRPRKKKINEAMEKYNEFEKLYNNHTKKETIKQKLNLTEYQYNNLRKKITR